jgi:hypothetical protein
MSTILELLQLSEAKNHMGERSFTTYEGWRRAIKKEYPDAWFDGDKDIANAMIGTKPYKAGETNQVGEWDGAEGSIHNFKTTNEAKNGPKIKPQKLAPGFYVCDEDDAPIHGPFPTDKKASREADNLNGGKNRGYRAEYWNGKRFEDHTLALGAMNESEDSDNLDALEAWQAAVRKAYPDVASKIRFRSNVKDDTVEAVVKGEDRLYGIFDMEKNKGEVLGD